MSQNALLDAPNASGYHAPGSYHSPMAAPPHQPPPPQWGPPPPVQQPRRWMPAAIISGAILITGAIIGGAILINSGNSNDTAAATSPSAAAPSAPGTQMSAADSSTCEAWRIAKADLETMPGMPAGWDWDTPGIDTFIANLNASIADTMNQFESDINENDPPQVVAAARNYIAAQRLSMKQFADHTYTGAGAPIATALANLNLVCGVS